MPEIWINYGSDEAVLEIMAENLGQTVRSGSSPTSEAGDGAGDVHDDKSENDKDAAGDAAVIADADSDGDHNNDDNTTVAATGEPETGTTLAKDTADNTGDAHSDDTGDDNNNDDHSIDSVPAHDNTLDYSAKNAAAPRVLGAPADNHNQNQNPGLEPDGILKKLEALDVSKPFDLVLMHDSQAVRQIVSSIFLICERRSVQFPGIMADRHILSGIKTGLPEGSVLEEFVSRTLDASVFGTTTADTGAASGYDVADAALAGNDDDDDNDDVMHAGATGAPSGTNLRADNGSTFVNNSGDAAGSVARGIDDNDKNRDSAASSSGRAAGAFVQGKALVFVSETEFDGLFGYETIATRLIRRFGADEMLGAYAKRQGNAPSPGKRAGGFDAAARFADRFEISGIDIVANSAGISDLFFGHPSKTAYTASASLESNSILDIAPQKAMIISTGKPSSSSTLGDALSSVWNCSGAVRGNGLCILVAECSRGLGPDAVRMYVEGMLDSDILQNPPAYVDGMEEMLFLQEAKKRLQVALVSILPEMYTDRLGIIPIPGMRDAVEYIKKTQGARQKATIVEDGSRLLLR